MKSSKSRHAISAMLTCVFLAGFGEVTPTQAQGTTSAVLGTVTDSSGAVIPDVMLQARNVGTGATQAVETDAQGRYRISDLPVGTYEIQASKSGFSTLLQKGITLTVGSQNVIDFTLQVGQAQQSVTVDAAVTQVETTSATVSTLVDQTQMHELPLNGRNFIQLMQLAPGVQNYIAGSTNVSSRQGRDPAITVAGSRPNGQLYLLDDQPLTTYYNRGLGSVTGTSLGLDAIAEFQTLTNTYGAQFGGYGAVMNAATKSGTNSFHGSAYEFLRNSALDARNFNDGSSVPSFRRNQYGGTIGGPVKKDKAFFFFNYEGLHSDQGITQIATVPLVRASTAADPKTAAAVNAVLALYPLPQFNINTTAGTGQANVVRNQPLRENYYLARFDYNFSNKDSFTGRYFFDKGNALYPFFGGATGILPEQDIGTSQFVNLEERHIFSPTVVNVVRVSYSRPGIDTPLIPDDIHPGLQFFPGAGRADATINVTGLTALGTITVPHNAQIQNRYSEADDISWIHGAHSFRFGASVDRVQSYVLWPIQAGSTWAFGSIPLFLAGQARQVTAVPNTPDQNNVRDFRNIDFAFYVQDDWKVTPKLVLNMGLRYQPASNPVEKHNNLFAITNYRTATGYTNVPHVFQSNINWANVDPRFGFAYDVFADHKTSVRGGFGMFHEVYYPGAFGLSYLNAPPWTAISQTASNNSIVFQNPSIAGGAPLLSSGGAVAVLSAVAGNAWQIDATPYQIQFNLNIQREVGYGNVVTVGYVGSHTVNQGTGTQANPVPATLDANGIYHFAPTAIGSGRTNPALGGFLVGVAGTSSNYHSLQASLNRRLARNVQAQVAYTYSKCMSVGDNAANQQLTANSPPTNENPYDRHYDYSVCGYNITQSLVANSLVTLPFHGNRFVEGWQVSGIVIANTGVPFNISDGVDQSNQLDNATVPRPNYAPNNPAVTIAGRSYPACNNTPILGGTAMYYNPNCFSQQAFGTLGNFGRNGLQGPGLVDLDLAISKSTKIREGMTLQFRAEAFNLLNHTNLGLPVATLFTGAPGPTTTLGRNSTAGNITTYSMPSRQIQFAVKLVF